jgi:response regulator NasT
MIKALRVVVADDEPELLAYYQSLLTAMGHTVVGTARNGAELVEQCRRAHPDLVITDVKMPEKDGIEAVLEAFRESPMRVILVTGYHAPGHIYRALREMVLAYLAKPFQQRELELAIERAEQRFEEFLALRDSGSAPQQAVEHRETLRLAKGILMKRNGFGDRAAFRHLQHLAQEKRLPLIQIAQSVIDAERALSS